MPNRFAAFGGILAICSFSACFRDPYPVGSERLPGGDYNNGGKGLLRRIIVTESPKMVYDIWRAEPNGRFTHQQFTLISPEKHPVESAKYTVAGSTGKCDDLTVRLYRDNQNKVVPGIIVVRFGNYEEPFGSAAHPLTPENYLRDRSEVARIRNEASDPAFYSSIPPFEKIHQFEGVPSCG
jgi:hypothetical protein